MTDRLRCTECQAVTPSDEVLRTTNPFNPAEEIIGCPACAAIDQFSILCQFEGEECRRDATCGLPTPAGYRHVCGAHYVEQVNRNKRPDAWRRGPPKPD